MFYVNDPPHVQKACVRSLRAGTRCFRTGSAVILCHVMPCLYQDVPSMYRQQCGLKEGQEGVDQEDMRIRDDE